MKYHNPQIVKGKPKIVYWSDPTTQRKLSIPQNLVYTNYLYNSIKLISYRISAVILGR